MRLIFFFAILLVQNAYSQNALRFQHINVEEGLSQSSVNGIYQDRRGFIWFTTGDGLNRYDGKHFVVYKGRFNDTNSTSIQNRNINSKIFEDRYNRIWFASDAGVSFRDTHTGKVKVVLDKYKAACASNLHDIDTAVWFSVPHHGIYAISVQDLKVQFYPFTDQFQNLSTISVIFSVAATANELWLADQYGLICFDKKTHKDARKLSKTGIISVEVLTNGKLLLGSANGVWLYDPNTEYLEFITIRPTDLHGTIEWKTCAEDEKSGIIYLGAIYGGYICKLDLANRKHELLAFQNVTINDLFVDRLENLWIGTDGNGVYKLDIKPPKFQCFRPKPLDEKAVENNFMVKSIYLADDGKVWMGVYNNGIVVYNPATQTQQKLNVGMPTDNELISSIIKDSSGYIVATIANKILWLDPDTHRVVYEVKLPPANEIPGSTPIIYALTEWKKGQYLLGTNLGVYLAALGKTPRAWRPEAFHNSRLLSSWAYNFYKTASGIIYVGLRDGFLKLHIISDTACRILDHGFNDLPVRHCYKSLATPILWIASEQGLIAYNEKTHHFKIFDETSGLANSFIYGILDQSDTSLWVSTNNGLSNVRINYDNEDNITALFTNYSIRDGLQSNEFNTGAHFKASDGTLYFGGIAGINWFNPSRVHNKRRMLGPVITSIFVNDSLYAGDTAGYVRTIVLPYNRNTISFTLSGLEFTYPQQSSLTYKLEGLDKEWVNTTNDNVRYSNLPPGSYTFMVRESDDTEGLSNTSTQLKVYILPPFWHTWWFYLLVSSLSLFIFFFLVRYFIRQKTIARIRELEKQQVLYLERLRISKDVHDDLGSGLSKISLVAAIALQKKEGDSSVGRDFQHISSVSKDLADNIRDLIWVLNPENATLEHLVSRLREYCVDYIENIPITVSLSFPQYVPDIRISRDAQRNIFLTLKEAVNNCIKHSGAETISISLTFDAHLMTISITDNGKGFAPQAVSGGGNGLRNMKQRITSIGGSFSISSSPGSPTTVAFSATLRQLQRDKNAT